MSVNIDAREVLTYLNELGYSDITSKQLKEFIRDLKILIKYDQKKAKIENQENIYPGSLGEYCYSNAELYDNTPDYDADVDDVAAQINHRDEQYLSEVFNYLHSATTYSSRAKSECQKKSSKNKKQDPTVISVEVLKPKPNKPFLSSGSSISNKINENRPRRPLSSGYSTTTTTNKLNDVRPKSATTLSSGYDVESTYKTAVKSIHVKSKLNKDKKAASESLVSNRIYGRKPLKAPARPTNSPITSFVSVSNPSYPPHLYSFTRPNRYVRSEPSAKKSEVPRNTEGSIGTELKPTTAFIRTRKPLKLCKSDPVALYQHYQEEWKKQKLPGEDKRYNLRWAVRERMLGEPDITQASGDKASRKPSRAS